MDMGVLCGVVVDVIVWNLWVIMLMDGSGIMGCVEWVVVFFMGVVLVVVLVWIGFLIMGMVGMLLDVLLLNILVVMVVDMWEVDMDMIMCGVYWLWEVV